MSKQLHIAVISFHSCPLGKLGGKDTGGMNVYIREMAEELSAKGHHIDIFTGAHGSNHEKVIQIGENIRLVHIETGSIVETPKVAFYSYLQNFICGIENFRNSVNIKYDIVHSHYWLSGLAGKQLQMWWHVPHVMMFHTLGAIKNAIAVGTDETELRIESERELSQSCDLIIAATDREKEDLVYYYNTKRDRIAVIPCGVNLDLFKPLNREKVREILGLHYQKIVLFVGRLDPLKGLEKLLQAFSIVTEKWAADLVIVGGDEHSHSGTDKLNNTAGELDIKDNVHFIGSVEQEKVPLYYSAADICIIPSYYESFGMVALESLACGTPVIASNVGAMKNIIKDPIAGEVIVDNSPHELAMKIAEVLSVKRDQVLDKEARRKLVTRYSWNNIADMLLERYDELIMSKIVLNGV